MSSSISVHSNGSFIGRQVRRASRDLLVWNGLVFGLLLAGAWFSGGYYYYFFAGPVHLDDMAILAAAERPSGGTFISYAELTDRELIPTGYVEESTREDKVYSVVPYFFAPVGDKLLLVKTYSQADGKRLVGPLQKLAVTTDVAARDGILKKHPELAGRILPIMINGAAAYLVAGYIGLAIGTPLVLLCGCNVGRACLGLGSPPLHPVARTLARYGDPRDVADQIDQEVAAGPTCQIGKVTVTSLWLLRPAAFGLTAIRLADVVWAYHLVLNGSHMAVVGLRSGKTLGIGLKRDQVPELLQEISARIPWVERGYDQELLKKWRKQRPEFIAEVDERRKKHLAS